MPSSVQHSFPDPSHTTLRAVSAAPSSLIPDIRRGALRLVLLVALFQAAVLLGAVSRALAAEPPAASPERSLVSVVGHGAAYGEPDLATLELGVAVSEPDVREAVRQLDSRIAAVMEAIRALGVPEQSIRTTSFNVWREERYQQESGGGRPTYRAHHILSVELVDAERAGEVLAAAVEAGANTVGGISFGIADPSELERQAREAAVRNARVKAQGFAEAAGATLGDPVSIEEVSASTGPVPMFDRAAASVMSESQVAPGRLSVEVRVAISYRLEQP